jgi:hypothetical protein
MATGEPMLGVHKSLKSFGQIRLNYGGRVQSVVVTLQLVSRLDQGGDNQILQSCLGRVREEPPHRRQRAPRPSGRRRSSTRASAERSAPRLSLPTRRDLTVLVPDVMARRRVPRHLMDTNCGAATPGLKLR